MDGFAENILNGLVDEFVAVTMGFRVASVKQVVLVSVPRLPIDQKTLSVPFCISCQYTRLSNVWSGLYVPDPAVATSFFKHVSFVVETCNTKDGSN